MKTLEYTLIHIAELLLSILIVLGLNIFIDLDDIRLPLIIILYFLLPSGEKVSNTIRDYFNYFLQ